MSLQTWIEEFYPESADVPKTDVERCKHSLKKWIGARPENLERHGVVKIQSKDGHGGDGIADSCSQFCFGADECALCCEHHDLHTGQYCPTCPLVLSGSMCCVLDVSPFITWCDTNDPEPMIDALEKALAYAEENE